MFNSARIKLTGYYLAIILLVSVIFSAAFYRLATREIDRIINRFQFEQRVEERVIRPSPLPFEQPSIEELLAYKKRISLTLVLVNSLIVLVAGTGGYFLAGKTLYPIKLMFDDQNRFISDASHELRTPLATLQAEMEGKLLEKTITDRQARLLIKSNLEEINSLKNLANRLLSLTKTHRWNGFHETEKLSLTDLINTAADRMKSLAKQKRIEFVINAKEAVLEGDKEALTELLVILLDNAIKYSPRNTKVSVKAQKSAETARIIVSDRGVGISGEDLPHIFERFYRSDKSRSETEGFGLGLAIAKKIVEVHRGKITAESTPGKGSIFTVNLPLAA